MYRLSVKMKVFILVLLLTIVKSQSVIYGSNTNALINKRCQNPNKRIGTCVAIHDCQVLMESERAFVVASACGGGYGKIPLVCCSSDTGFDAAGTEEITGSIGPSTTTTRTTFSWFKSLFKGNFFSPSNEPEEESATWQPMTRASSSLLPEPPTCGGEFIDNRIYGGSDADAYDFPWMAYLEYAKTDPLKESVCAGSLITARYVVTAAHCVVGPILSQKGDLVAVRLGLLDYTKSSVFGEDNQRWRIEEKIIHENYRQQKTPMHDIALLRLNTNVRYSKTIRPICLPSVITHFDIPNDTQLTVAGWGATETQSSSPIKQKVRVTLMDQQFCKQQYSKFGLTIEPTHMCAGGNVANQDSCRGDSGAPLMHYRQGVWILEGIVSFGRRCGIQNWPGVYVRLSFYTEWINKKLKK